METGPLFQLYLMMSGSYLLELFGLFMAHNEERCLIGLTTWTLTTKEMGSIIFYPTFILCFPFILILFSLCLKQSRSVTPTLFFTALSQVGRPSPKAPLTSIKSDCMNIHELLQTDLLSRKQRVEAHWSFLFYLCVCLYMCVFSPLAACRPAVHM